MPDSNTYNCQDLIINYVLTNSAKLRGQCYNGASIMSGKNSGMVKHNLAASDAIESSELMRNALDTTHEITKHIKYSPWRDGIFHESHATNSTPGILSLCPTIWTVLADSLANIINHWMTHYR